MFRPDLVQRLRERLGDGGPLGAVVGLAEAQKTPLFLVGGSVRDLVLERPSPDLDLVVEGDAVALARALADALGGRCIVHRQFGTASVRGQGFAVDLASARSEAYPRPGALPVVSAATLEQDLARRDFTINAMALALAGRRQGELLDPYGGLGDIDRRLIRLLHDASFVDDATRILRAVRYETRLQFHIEPHTIALIHRDKHYLATVNGARLRLELGRILTEEVPEAALRRCQELGVLAAIDPVLRFDDELSQAFALARGTAPSPLVVYLALLAVRLSPAEAASLAQRLASTKGQRQAMAAAPQALAAAERLGADAHPSQVVQALQPYPEAALRAVALAAHRPYARELAHRYLQEWRHVRPALDGHALGRLGVQPGPKMREVIERLCRERLDGRVRGVEDEVQLVKGMLGRSLPKSP